MVAQPTWHVPGSFHDHGCYGEVADVPRRDSAAQHSQDLRHPVHTIAAELADRSPCIRRTALGKLQCALSSSILATCDPERDTKPLLRSLLEWFNLPSPSHEILVLSMLTRLAQDWEYRELLVSLGAVEFMEQYQADCCQTIAPYVSSFLRNLSEQNDETTREPSRSMYLMDTGLGYVVPTIQHSIQASQDQVHDTRQQPAQCHSNVSDSPVQKCSAHPRQSKPFLVVPDIIERNFPSKDKRRGMNSASSRDASPENILRRPASRSWGESRASSNILEADDGQLCCQHSPHDGINARADRMKLDSPLTESPAAHILSDIPMTVTLQYLDDPEALVGVLKEIREAVIIDFHPEAILQKYPIVQNSFSLLLKVRDSNLERLVFDILIEFLRQIKAALILSREVAFHVHLECEPFPQCLPDIRDACPEKSQNLEFSYPVYIKPRPDYALDDGKFVKLLAGRVLDRKEIFQPAISVGRTLHTIVLQLIALLADKGHRDMSLVILYDLLPVLKPSRETRLDDQVQACFAQYFQALCEVLRTFDENLKDLEILCTDIKGKKNFEKRARRCSSIMKLLTFSSELLCLLEPADVTGLVPTALLKPLVILAGDLILSECAFSALKNIFPYFKALDPLFFKSYTCATEASFTLHVLVKELATSEELVSLWKAEKPGKRFTRNTERLLKSMIQAVPKFAYFNYNYLVPRVIHILPDVLTMELANFCQSSASYMAEADRRESKSTVVEDLIADASTVILLLLSHANEPVRRIAYHSMVDVSTEEIRRAQQEHKFNPKVQQEWDERSTISNIHIYSDDDNCHSLLQRTNGSLRPLKLVHRLLIFGTSNMGEIITVGLHETSTCKQAAQLLQRVIQSLSDKEKAKIAPAYSWIACSTCQSSYYKAMIEELNATLFPARLWSPEEDGQHDDKNIKLEWMQLSILLRPLFSSSTTDRRRGSGELLKVLRQRLDSEGVGWWWLTSSDSLGDASRNPETTETIDLTSAQQLQLSKDPFQEFLKFKEETLYSMAFESPTKKSRAKDTFKVSQDAEKKLKSLLKMLKSTSVEKTTRKTVVEQLADIAYDLRQEGRLEFDEDLFEILVAEIVEWMRTDVCAEEHVERSTGSHEKSGSSERSRRPDKGLAALGIACLGLLTRLALAPPLDGAPCFRDMLIHRSCETMWLLLPLVFHPFERVRKDMALLLASALFNSDMLFRDLDKMGLKLEPSSRNVSPTSDHVEDHTHSRQDDIMIEVPRPFIGGHLFPCKVIAIEVRKIDQGAAEPSVNEQVVHRIIAQSVLLQGGHDALLSSIESRVMSTEDPLQNTELQGLACLNVLHAEVAMKKLLKLLADPQLCCGLEAQFLEELEAQSCRHPQAAKMLAKLSWMVAFERFLRKKPLNQDDVIQLLKVIRLVEVIINSGSASSEGLIFLSTIAKQTLLPLLARNFRKEAKLDQAVVLIEGYPALDMSFNILSLLVAILMASMNHRNSTLFGYMANSLAKDTNLLPVLVSKFVSGPSRPYICCVLAVKCISLVAKGVASVSANSGSTSPLRLEFLHRTDHHSSDEGFSEREGRSRWNLHGDEIPQQNTLVEQEDCLTIIGSELVEVVLPLIKHIAHAHSNHDLSFQHKQLVRESISCLWSITCSIPPYLWEDLWFSIGIVHWLSRLLDDQEAIVRGMGFGILAVLASPATLKTRSLLEQNWPDLGEIVVCTVLNSQECYAVREEAVRFLISSTVWSRSTRSTYNDGKRSTPAGFDRIDGLGVNAALQRYKFWMLFPTMLQAKDGTPGFYRAVLELILKLTVTDLDFIKSKILVNPHIFQALIRHLDFETKKEEEDTAHRMFSSDTYCSKSYVGEILCILAQHTDDRLLFLIQNESVIAKLLGALSQCCDYQSLVDSNVQVNTEHKKSRKQTASECRDLMDAGNLGKYERLQGAIHLAEALNLVVCQIVEAATPPKNSASNHIRVDDVMTLNLREDSCERRSARGAVGIVVGRSGICRSIARILQSAKLTKYLQIAGKENDTSRVSSSLFKRANIAICALIATLLSDESLTTAIFNGDEHRSDKSDACDTRLATLLYNAFLQIIKDIHEMGQQPNISHDGASLAYLHRLLFTVGIALQNLLSFSSQAKDSAIDSDMSYTLVSYAYEAYTVLGSCGLAPMRNSSVMGITNHRPKRCDKAFKMINQQIRPLVWSRQAKQGKLSEHHRTLLLGELIICFRLLKNLVFEHPSEAESCIEDGIFDFIRLVWGFSLNEEELIHEILGLLCNLAAQSDVAKDIIACQAQIYQGGKLGTIMDNVAAIVLYLPSDQQSYTLSIKLLQILVTMTKARAFFLRKQFVSEFLHHFCQSVQNNDVLREQLILQLLINVSVFPNGQKMISRGLSDGRTLDLVLDTVDQTNYVPASCAAMFLLRNLAFCRETRFFFLCNDRTLPLLVQTLGSSSLESRAHAASALWILTSTEKRTSSVLKKLDAWPSLLAAHEASKLHMKIFRAYIQKSGADKQDGRIADKIYKMGKLVKHIEQSLFAVNQLVGGVHMYD